MAGLKSIRSKLKQVYYGEAHEQKGLSGVFTYLVRYSVHIFGELHRDQCFLRAAALTFTTVMTLIPIMVLLFVTFRAFGGLEDASDKVQQFLFQHMMPESVANIRSYIENLVMDFNSHAVSYISLLFLIGYAYALFASVDSSLNIIWGARQQRNILKSLVTIWFLLTVVPVLLGYSLYLTARLRDVIVFDNAIGQAGFAVFRRLTPYFLSFISVTLLYKLIPRTRVQWSSAAIGGSVAALFWELTKYGFNYYVQNLSNFQLLYGSFLTLPVFLIWVDVSWIITLAGAEVAFTHQHLDRLHLLKKGRQLVDEEKCLISDKLGVYLFFVIAENFDDGRSVKLNDLHMRVPGNEWYVDKVLEKLRNGGFIVMDTDGQLAPSRNLGKIMVGDLFEYFETETPGQYFRLTEDKCEPGETILHRVRDARIKHLSGMSVKDAMNRYLEDECV